MSRNVDSSSAAARSCSVNGSMPAAYSAPPTLPALVPATTSARMPWASSILITPMWAKPLAAPPPSALPMRGCATGSGAAGGDAGGGSAGAGPRAPQAARATRTRPAHSTRPGRDGGRGVRDRLRGYPAAAWRPLKPRPPRRRHEKGPVLDRPCSIGFGGGGAREDRTPDLVIANDALSQLSYGPTAGGDYTDVAPASPAGSSKGANAGSSWARRQPESTPGQSSPSSSDSSQRREARTPSGRPSSPLRAATASCRRRKALRSR